MGFYGQLLRKLKFCWSISGTAKHSHYLFTASAVPDVRKKGFAKKNFFPVLPEQPVVLDRWGRQLNSTKIGPKQEGEDIILSCRVVGGKICDGGSW